MIEIEFTESGYKTNQVISNMINESSKSATVKVNYKINRNKKTNELEDEVCDYLTLNMTKNVSVKTNHVTLCSKTSESSHGKYVEEIIFQVFI